jgi:hypothetical protein
MGETVTVMRFEELFEETEIQSCSMEQNTKEYSRIVNTVNYWRVLIPPKHLNMSTVFMA